METVNLPAQHLPSSVSKICNDDVVLVQQRLASPMNMSCIRATAHFRIGRCELALGYTVQRAQPLRHNSTKVENVSRNLLHQPM